MEEQNKNVGFIAESRRRILLAVSRVDPKTRNV
jgi:hypothetical protein